MLVSNTHGFAAGQWVEITTDAQELLGKPGDFVKIRKVEGGALYLESSQPWSKDSTVRRWDQTRNLTDDGAVKIDNTWIDLEDGLQIQFQPSGTYRTGDYWLIPARTTGAIEWPNEAVQGSFGPAAQAPHGITHHYAPLRVITVDVNGTVTPGDHDLRCLFDPVAKCPPVTPP